MCKKKLVNECKVSGGRMTRALRWVRGMEQRGISGLTAAAVCAVGSGGGEGQGSRWWWWWGRWGWVCRLPERGARRGR